MSRLLISLLFLLGTHTYIHTVEEDIAANVSPAPDDEDVDDDDLIYEEEDEEPEVEEDPDAS